ncbi:uncharacterized protein CC84DRAFT_622190 [Paraphaeosphaeria sporulosa]|uniref:Uncharacterized protein n=1 Tax=Paraphaeosphaeria sporulosa TaxID=1460663 RepID=A0A177CHU4_9PLEO|nr:uncharacterized protein CC84DRAFT_622190 [Paraphaeosphaeria sporulosa]OAG06811.1 hypothetical protein CC84DRAFT_622190 [Paraphaeosphaeria sporulosa]
MHCSGAPVAGTTHSIAPVHADPAAPARLPRRVATSRRLLEDFPPGVATGARCCRRSTAQIEWPATRPWQLFSRCTHDTPRLTWRGVLHLHMAHVLKTPTYLKPETTHRTGRCEPVLHRAPRAAEG